MPFITRKDRKKIDNLNLSKSTDLLFEDASETPNMSVGDRCYYFYKEMMAKWKQSRRWTTAHNIYKQMIYETESEGYSDDTKIAYKLAWEVFFSREVLKYEEEKVEENGDIV